MALCVLALWASRGEAASLMVHGPAGATIEVDGRLRGTLPLAEAIELPLGTHGLRVEQPGYRTHVESFTLDDRDHDLILTVSLLEISRWKATGYSLVLAGLGQHYQDRHVAGWTMLVVQLAAASVAAYGEIEFKDKRDAYEDALSTYERAVDQNVIVEQREKALAAYDDMDSAQTIRNVALWAVLGTAVISAVDAWLAHDGLVVQGGDAALDSPGRDQSVQVGWRLRF
jgi:hypothetical protein